MRRGRTYRAGIGFAAALARLAALPTVAGATQGHGGGEGLYVHQLSHIFFCISMGILIYWLKTRNLTREPGWRYIGISALLFLLWSVDAFTVHLLDEQFLLIRTQTLEGGRLYVETGDGLKWMGPVYYLAKLDHLLCVPAMIFLYVGLRRLMTETGADADSPGAGGGAA